VNKEALLKLEALEKQEAQKRDLEDFKFSSNEEMLDVVGLLAKTEHY
jgi:hypothetical protein